MDEFEQLVVVGQSLIEAQDSYQQRNLELFDLIKANLTEVLNIRRQQMEQIKNDIHG